MKRAFSVYSKADRLVSCLQFCAGGSHVRPVHPSVGSSGLGTSCSPSPPKSILSQSAPADVDAFTLLHCHVGADDSIGHVQVTTQISHTESARN